MATTDPRVLRVAAYLELLIFESGMPIRVLENRLGVSHGTIARLLSGRVELKFRHVFEILDVLEISEDVFYQGLATGGDEKPRASDLRRKMHRAPLPAPTPGTASITREEVVELIKAYMAKSEEGAEKTDEKEPPQPAPPPPVRRRRRTPKRTKKTT